MEYFASKVNFDQSYHFKLFLLFCCFIFLVFIMEYSTSKGIFVNHIILNCFVYLIFYFFIFAILLCFIFLVLIKFCSNHILNFLFLFLLSFCALSFLFS